MEKPPFSLPNCKVLTARVSDTGQYVCVADNVAGSAEKSFNLNVHGECHVNVCNIILFCGKNEMHNSKEMIKAE